MKKSCPIKSKKPFRKHLLSYIRCIVIWDYIFSSVVVVSSVFSTAMYTGKNHTYLCTTFSKLLMNGENKIRYSQKQFPRKNS